MTQMQYHRLTGSNLRMFLRVNGLEVVKTRNTLANEGRHAEDVLCHLLQQHGLTIKPIG